jgi:TonB family protein
VSDVNSSYLIASPAAQESGAGWKAVGLRPLESSAFHWALSRELPLSRGRFLLECSSGIMKHLTVALALLTLTMLPSAGQEGDSETRIQIKTMEIPRYLPLAQQAGISGNVTLHLTVNKNGDVTVVDVVSAHPKDWGKGFASMAIEAAKRSQFSCASCTGDAFEHTVTYLFDFPPDRTTLARSSRHHPFRRLK